MYMDSKPKSTYFFHFFLLALIVCATNLERLNAQSLFFNSTEIYVDSGVTIHINGAYENALIAHPVQTTSLLENNGEITVASHPNPGNFIIRPNTTVRGGGAYNVEQNWVNSSTNFISNKSKVTMFGDQEQVITGSEVTQFGELILTGSGLSAGDRVKRMEIDIRVKDTLNLNDRELAADSFAVFVENPVPNAIYHNDTIDKEGFVSTLNGDLQNGYLSRRTSNSSDIYVFPVGSSINPPSGKEYVYRPVEITPSSASVNEFTTNFTYNDPSLDGYDILKYDTTICTVNDLYYHIINHPVGFDSAHTSIVYDPIEDGIYDRFARWKQFSDTLWNNEIKARLTTDLVYNRVTLNNNRIFSNDTLPFALTDLFPLKPTIEGPDAVCSGTNDLLFIGKGNTDFYEWSIPSGVQISSGATNDSIRLNFGDTGGAIRAIATSATGRCKETSDSLVITINPSPVAGFEADTNNVFTSFNIQFTDTSSGTPVEWLWKFGDGDSSLSPVPKHAFKEIGEFPVSLFITDTKGCIDSASTTIRIIEGIKIPNVFTPNGDGINDFFIIANSGLADYHVQIFNRWGNLLFETTAAEIIWDGRTPAGKPVEAGTYFYILRAASRAVDYDTKGFITVLR